MAFIKIPTRNDLGYFSERVVLDGEIFILEIRYNSRFGLWIMDILNENGNPVAEGVPLQTGIVLLHGFIEVDLPKGYFMVLGDTQVTVDASESDLGDTVNLYYSEAS